MGTIKMILLAGLAALVFAACGNKDTSNMDLSELRRECEMLRQDRAKALENNIEAQELIDNIFASVNSLSGRTASLERSLEDNPVNDSRRKAEEIAQDISAIREKLERAEELEKYDKSTKMVIAKLKTTLEQKQEEIDELKKVIQTKDKQIQELDKQVSSLDDQLGRTNQELAESNAELISTKEQLRESEINSWVVMGDELIRAAETLPKVKGHGNMKPIKRAKLTILLKARSCYQNAVRLGCSSASSKIAYTERLYRENS